MTTRKRGAAENGQKTAEELVKRHDAQNSGTESLRNFLYKFFLEPCFIASF